MDEHDLERIPPGWQAASEAVARELVCDARLIREPT
jgi:hypothetical protein